jgi:toxin-antitoxin system PIN domain toxin
MFLPDVNVLLAMAFEAHAHHEAAKRWFSAAGSLVVCRMTQSAFLRLASNPALWGEEALTLSEAWSCFDALVDDDRFVFGREPLGLEHMWRRLTIGGTYSPKVWNDRYLAAFAMTEELTLVSFDTAFRDVPELSSVVLTA